MCKEYLSDIMPFRLHENIYFIGSSRVSVHLIRTEEGLVIIDTGYPEMYEQILDSMEYLGFDPKDICAVFHSHGHIDHFGCTQKLHQISKAVTYISRIDNEVVNGHRDLSWAKELGYETLPFFDCDVLVEDGDCFVFGETKIRCMLVPGHTEGVLAFFISTGETGAVAAMHGGIGLNSLTAEYLNRCGLALTLRDRFREGLHRLAKEHVDLVLGNHPGQSDTEGKLRRLLAGETDVTDPDEWRAFLQRTEEQLDQLLFKEKEAQR